MKRGAAHVVGSRPDYFTWSARIALSDAIVPMLKARGLLALREDTPCALALGPHTFRLLIPGRSGKWVLQNDAVRAVVLEHGAGRQGEADPGWNVEIDCSGTELLALGYDAAFRLFWEIGRELGDLIECRLGRIDLCADVAGYGLRPGDRSSFIKQRRVSSRDCYQDGLPRVETKKRRTTSGQESRERVVHWDADRRRIVELLDGEDGKEAVHYAGDTFTAITFGSRKSVSARIYDKRLQLETQAADKRAAEHAEWRRHGWDGAEDVARVEFEIRGEAMKELRVRCETRGEEGPGAQAAKFREAVDELWAYCTRKWLRLVRRGEPDVVQPRWRAVQAVTFERAAEPRERKRKRGASKAPQALGCALSLTRAAGRLATPWRPRVDADGVIVDELRAKDDPADFVKELVAEAKTPEEADVMAKRELARVVADVAANMVAPIVSAELDRARGVGVRALARVYTKVGAALARIVPDDAQEGSAAA